MFIPPLKIGDVINNKTLTEMFQVANMRGMRYSSYYNVLVLISNHYLKRINPILNPYDDKWIGNVLYYTGEGTKGDQSLSGQNWRLYYKKYDALYLFEVFDKKNDKQLYTYQGPVELAGTPIFGNDYKLPECVKGKQPDSDGNYRNVWIFPIRKLG